MMSSPAIRKSADLEPIEKFPTVVHGRDSDAPNGVRVVSLKLDTDRKGVFARYREGILIVALPKCLEDRIPASQVRH